MLDATWLEFELGSEDPPASNVQKIFDILKPLEKTIARIHGGNKFSFGDPACVFFVCFFTKII